MSLNCILRIVFCIALYVLFFFLFLFSVIVLIYLFGYYYDSIVRSCDL